ncbi:CHAT domain-containing protein [Allorhizocola rhizosphaerae]|uniref:CHAT domain-containing protein n=1 Tax=Allorhizocola rhizosphaerae TaxID=1872709 RepID=UPI000E3EA203|nr:CHAT domain-containing protein [Allorhizocola rhizosphaerae]
MTVIARVEVLSRSFGPGQEVRFVFPTIDATVHLPLPDSAALNAARTLAGDYLGRVVEPVVRRRPTLRQAATALRILLHKGRELAHLLTQLDRDRVLRLQHAFRQAWPTWAAADWDREQILPTVEFFCHDGALPLEILPVFDFGPMPDIRIDDDLRRAAARFLGFSAVVHRITRDSVTGDHTLRSDPLLPVQFFRHRPRFGGHRHPGLLGHLTEAVRLEGPWPVSESKAAFRQALVNALYHGRSLDGGEPGDPPVQIQHFACHCDTTGRHDEYMLTLSTRRRQKRTITLGELSAEYDDRFYQAQHAAQSRAVIVLDACASSRTNPTTALSFPRWFLSYGHRAFIGTETKVPDAVAAAFTDALYGRLLQGAHPLGAVVVHARRDLMRDTRNPLGILYVIYGDVELMVDRRRPDVYRGSRGLT